MAETGFQQEDTKETGRFENLPFTDRLLAEVSMRPRWAVYGLTAILAGLAWLWLSTVAIGVSGSGGTELGPATGYLPILADYLHIVIRQDGIVAWLIRACLPQPGSAADTSVYVVAFAMWAAMSVAMMLPSAAPMMRTYADISDVAAGQGKHAVSISILVMGYLVVWLAFAALAAALQLALIALGAVNDAVTPLQGALGGVLLVLAGLYQFSALKNACLEKCRNPFSTLFGRWTDRVSGVFRLGAEQGLFCLGCCWALMFVMLVVGTMNLAWMAFFTLFTLMEKSVRGKVTSYLSGGILLAWGGSLFSLSVFGAAAH